MITNIPMIYSSQLKNANERTFISILWLLSSYNNSPAFFSKEYVSYIGSNRVFDSLITTLTQRNIISYFVKGVGASKHRYFTIIDPAILEELKHTKNQKQTKPQKETQNKPFKECDEEKQQQQLELNVNSIFSAMNEIKNEFTDYVFTDEEIRENAQSYLDKSQGYKFYKGKPTKAKIKAWLTQYLKQKKEKTSVVSGSGDLAKRLSAMNQLNEMMRKRSHTEKKVDPIDADFEIIDEQKNALA